MKGFYIGKLDESTVNSVINLKLNFVWTNSNNFKFLKALKNQGIKLFCPIAVFCSVNKTELKYKAINKQGKIISTYAGWYNGLCPNREKLRNKRLQSIKRAFENKYFDGVFLDSIRFPTYWETKEPVYLDTCYCKTCLSLQKQSGDSWIKFRQKTILSFLGEIIKLKPKNKTVGYFAAPESEKRLKEIFAQEPRIFKKYVDYVSPMIYPQMVGKDDRWGNETVQYFSTVFSKNSVVPILQVVKMPENSPDIFSEADAINFAQDIKSEHKGFFMMDQVKDNEIFMQKLLA